MINPPLDGAEPTEPGSAEWDRYVTAMHAVQSGIAQSLHIDPDSGNPKHLRVGVSSAMCSHNALTALLVSKGVITQDEYMTALADDVEREKQRLEQELTAHYHAKYGTDTKITLA